MGRLKKERAPLPPIWEAPDELWAMIAPILARHDPPKRGPKRIDQHRALQTRPELWVHIVAVSMRNGLL